MATEDQKKHPGFYTCTCPKPWLDSKNHHHPTCVRNPICILCTRTKDFCKRMGCKGIRKNSTQKKVDNVALKKIFDNLYNLTYAYVAEIKTGHRDIPASEKKDVWIRRAFICGNQFDAIKQITNPSTSDIDKAETCLYKLKRVYFDMKTMVKELQTAAKN